MNYDKKNKSGELRFSAQKSREDRSSARITARNPTVRRQGRARGAVAVHRYDLAGSSPA